ncbi:uncharacterized protein LOC120257550 [Dioscorea cayenensis subsp. rotundata]|uniref:Uncharacterized protein LOC120257550 n=1 Tax=Dioscorea cayennensis subsp. rotundata TaxID=55577 RepID=A0AB40B2M6_DIOCR|nr:uncharacterized protein LOC120257550 [Dioscorea cayenensis subsp. rotundata]
MEKVELAIGSNLKTTINLEKDAKMPRYAKFLKELLKNKRELEEVSSVTLSEECSALITNKLRKKEKNPRGFIVPCTISGLVDDKALDDLGYASISCPTKFSKDVLIKVDKFIFPVDFIILDIDDEVEVPFILGRLLLATSKALIDVKDGQITLRDMFIKDELAELLENDRSND